MTYGSSRGVIDKTFNQGNGFTIVESFTKRDGTTGKTWVTVFPKDSNYVPVVGTSVKVDGVITSSGYQKQDGSVGHSLVINATLITLDTPDTSEAPF